MFEACKALRREIHDVLYASLIKDTMKRKKPSFDESYHGYRSFSHLLEDADNHALIDIERNPKSGTYVVIRFGDEPVVSPRPVTVTPVRRRERPPRHPADPAQPGAMRTPAPCDRRPETPSGQATVVGNGVVARSPSDDRRGRRRGRAGDASSRDRTER